MTASPEKRGPRRLGHITVRGTGRYAKNEFSELAVIQGWSAPFGETDDYGRTKRRSVLIGPHGAYAVLETDSEGRHLLGPDETEKLVRHLEGPGAWAPSVTSGADMLRLGAIWALLP